MIIVGLDMSINSPGLVKFALDGELNITSKDYLTFSTVKKYGCDNIITFKKDQFKYEYDQYIFIRDKIIDFIKGVDYVAMEGYSYSSTGQVFNIAEMTSCIKMYMYENNIPFRIYDIASIKISNNCKGNCDKISMEINYEKLEDKVDLSFLPMVYEKKAGNPKDNIVDAFCICKLLLLEIKLRTGRIAMRTLDESSIRIFNRITKSNPVNILDNDFIRKST
jgi:hypothetical protein